ncbi:acyl CoA binding protein-domain-containing protein [Aspergillus caelatus]|uniref:Acyl CoA binding protein-domain-containing protein n=2 Tax=Aspergillus subgen. Circumdati TaxID=2720871 RepID=A0A5N6ZUD4_9EURO|nr:acyl CoA binding protein-domain-containing protein [Aspergillus caelatus]KAE8359870.1 acyl CoA binding protein-domain-containing protein [Aspergillus caelatus]KAE8412655.1 acyl CoA binding protein-domain-containing protein [Aspergillus pseudocaelatus]
MSINAFLENLSYAQSGAKFAELQPAASGINVDLLKAAVEAVLAGGDDAKVEGPLADALKAGFEFAAKLVKELKSKPGQEEMLTFYKYFKQASNDPPSKPGLMDFVGKAKYNAWEKIKDISDQRAQALYIQEVSKAIEAYGTNE